MCWSAYWALYAAGVVMTGQEQLLMMATNWGSALPCISTEALLPAVAFSVGQCMQQQKHHAPVHVVRAGL